MNFRVFLNGTYIGTFSAEEAHHKAIGAMTQVGDVATLCDFYEEEDVIHTYFRGGQGVVQVEELLDAPTLVHIEEGSEERLHLHARKVALTDNSYNLRDAGHRAGTRAWIKRQENRSQRRALSYLLRKEAA